MPYQSEPDPDPSTTKKFVPILIFYTPPKRALIFGYPAMQWGFTEYWEETTELVCKFRQSSAKMLRDKSWMGKDRDSPEWQKGMKEFLEFAFHGAAQTSTVPCPCRKCLNICQKTRKEVHIDLLRNGMDPDYTCWKYHGEGSDNESVSKGSSNEEVTRDDAAVRDILSSLIRGSNLGNSSNIEEADHAEHREAPEGAEDIREGSKERSCNQEPNACAKAFFNLLKEAKKELYPSWKEVTKLSFIVRLYQIKCLYGLSNKACEAILQLFSLVLPEGHCIPNSVEKVQKVIRDLGLDYHKIHACINDCVLFRKEYSELDSCPCCGESRWKTDAYRGEGVERQGRRTKKPVPHKVLR